MSIQDPRQDSFDQQPSGAPGASTAYNPVNDAAAGSVPPAGYPGGPYPGAGYPGPVVPGAPNPALAALLGFIPGVGAMYNGQFAKGIAHIAIFATFSSLAKHVEGIFGLFVAGWIFYMVFEAYQTARARRDGLPLPDPFGLNNVGERFGFRNNADFTSFWGHGGTPPPPPGAANVDGAPFYSRPDAPGAQAGYQVDPAGNVYAAPPAPGYAPPATGYAPPQAGYVPPAAPGYPPYGAPPVPPYTANAYGGPAYGMPPMPPMPPVPPASGLRNGLPSGALWLIGLGFFALLGSLHSFQFLEGEATGGIFLMGLGAFLFFRRYMVNRVVYPAGSAAARWNFIRASRGAGVVFVVGLLTLLQGLHVVAWDSSWPFLLIFLGVFILLERIALNRMNADPAPGYAAPAYAPPGYAPYAPEQPVETSSPTVSPTSIVPRSTRPENDLDNTEGR